MYGYNRKDGDELLQLIATKKIKPKPSMVDSWTYVNAKGYSPGDRVRKE